MEDSRSLQKKLIDSSTVTGILIAFAMVISAIFIGGNVKGFYDTASVFIVVFGTFAVTTACFSFAEVIAAQGAIIHTIFYRREDISAVAENAMYLAEISRKNGVLELDKYEHLTMHNNFLHDGIQMIVDNTKQEEIEKVLDNELGSLHYRHSKSVAVLRKSAEVAPAMGLIGTLIGLVQMLGNIEDTSSIGPAMAVAILTTFYGAILSYLFFAPLASKLERNTRDEMLVARIYIQAVKSIANRESPRKLEMVLNSMLPPDKRVQYKMGAGEKAEPVKSS